ncbi:MAG: PIG-L family deacetylase [Acidimicrobiales bacterium]
MSTVARDERIPSSGNEFLSVGSAGAGNPDLTVDNPDGDTRGVFSRRALLRSAVIGGSGVALAACGRGIAAASGSGASATSGPAQSRTLITCAHADDNLLFMSPDEITLIKHGNAVQVVYLTTGDAGLGQSYWHLREEGARAGAAYMAGVPNRWRRGSVALNGHTLVLDTLIPDPRLTMIFMRLPDGNVDGSGWADTSFESLMKLWKRDIPTISSADGATYTLGELRDTLVSITKWYKPGTVYTQDFLGYFGNGDHTDHVATGYLTEHANRIYHAPNRPVFGYQGYPIHLLPPNVHGPLLVEKEQTFLAYSKYDSHGCSTLSECFAPPWFSATYGNWFERQYVVAKIPAGSTTAHSVSV